MKIFSFFDESALCFGKELKCVYVYFDFVVNQHWLSSRLKNLLNV